MTDTSATKPERQDGDGLLALADEIERSTGLLCMVPGQGTMQLGIKKTAQIIAALRATQPARDAAEGATVSNDDIEVACAAYAKATNYYVEFHRGLSSVSSDEMRKGMRAALTALSPSGAGPADHSWLNDLIKAAEAFRAAMVSSNVVGRYNKELRALESALDPLNYRAEAGAGEPVDQNDRCERCGKRMPPGEEMFRYHGYSGDCPEPKTNAAKLRRQLRTERINQTLRNDAIPPVRGNQEAADIARCIRIIEGAYEFESKGIPLKNCGEWKYLKQLLSQPGASERDDIGKALEGHAAAYRQNGGMLFSGFTIADELDEYAIRALSRQAPPSSSEGGR